MLTMSVTSHAKSGVWHSVKKSYFSRMARNSAREHNIILLTVFINYNWPQVAEGKVWGGWKGVEKKCTRSPPVGARAQTRDLLRARQGLVAALHATVLVLTNLLFSMAIDTLGRLRHCPITRCGMFGDRLWWDWVRFKWVGVKAM